MPSLSVVFGSLFAAVLVALGAMVLHRQHRRLWRAERTTGRVVSSGVEPWTTPWSEWSWRRATDVVRSGDGERADDSGVAYEYRGGGEPALEPAVEYEYRVGAEQYTNDTVWPAGVEPTRWLLGGGSEFPATVVDRFPEGEPVTVYYDPADPGDAFLLRERNWLLPVVCLVLAALLGLWAVHCSGMVYVTGDFAC